MCYSRLTINCNAVLHKCWTVNSNTEQCYMSPLRKVNILLKNSARSGTSWKGWQCWIWQWSIWQWWLCQWWISQWWPWWLCQWCRWCQWWLWWRWPDLLLPPSLPPATRRLLHSLGSFPHPGQAKLGGVENYISSRLFASWISNFWIFRLLPKRMDKDTRANQYPGMNSVNCDNVVHCRNFVSFVNWGDHIICLDFFNSVKNVNCIICEDSMICVNYVKWATSTTTLGTIWTV